MKVQCDKCGKYFETDEELGYCPFCENDQVEVFKNQLLNVQMVSAKEITKLHKELALTEKALELACETYWNDCGMEDCPCDIDENFSNTNKKCKTCHNGGDMFVNDKGCCWVDYFKTKAKEMMKSE